MWEIIPKIGTPLAALAFLVAIIGWVVRRNLTLKYRALEGLPPEDRLRGLRDIIGATAPDNEPHEIEARLHVFEARYKTSLTRFKWLTIAGLVCFLSVLIAVVIVFSVRPRPFRPPEPLPARIRSFLTTTYAAKTMLKEGPPPLTVYIPDPAPKESPPDVIRVPGAPSVSRKFSYSLYIDRVNDAAITITDLDEKQRSPLYYHRIVINLLYDLQYGPEDANSRKSVTNSVKLRFDVGESISGGLDTSEPEPIPSPPPFGSPPRTQEQTTEGHQIRALHEAAKTMTVELVRQALIQKFGFSKPSEPPVTPPVALARIPFGRHLTAGLR
jgi:hypothetical protein